MSQIDLEKVKAILVDRNANIRHLTRSALWSIGIHDVTPCRHISEVPELMEEEDFDLLLLNLDGEKEEVCDAVRNIRHERLGTNPFVVVMALAWQPDWGVTMPTLNAGTDDLVAKPVSVQTLLNRIGNLVFNRKDFVVTLSYVGPDRRAAARRKPEDLPPIPVPNSLRYKATRDEAAAITNEAIKRALRMVHTHRVYRIASKLSAETRKLEQETADHPERSVPMPKLRELALLVAMANEHISREGLEQLSRIGHSMGDVMDAILKIEKPSVRDLEILRLHGHAVAAAIQERDEAAALLASALDKAAELVRKTLH